MSEKTANIVEKAVELSWWKKFFRYKRDGNKFSLSPRSLTLLFSVLGVILISSQLLVGTDTGSAPMGKSGVLPAEIEPQPSLLDIPKRIINSTALTTNQKKRTADNLQYSGPELILRPRDLGAIPPGSMLEAVLVTGGSNGLVRAEVLKGLYVDGGLLIPTGSTLVGNGSSSEERLFISFSQIVFKDGAIGNITAEACDSSDKIMGLKGNKIGTGALNIAGSIGLGFLGGFSEALQDTEGQQGAVIRKPSVKNALLNATATTALEQSRNLMSDLKYQTPIIEVPQGRKICVMFGGGR